MPPAPRRVFAELKQHGLLLLNDPDLPNLCALIVGERVRGSWWVHPQSQIFAVYDAMEDHPDVLIMKLISGSDICPQVVAVGCARNRWPMEGMSAAARKLLANVDRAPVELGRTLRKAASELEARMLVYGA